MPASSDLTALLEELRDPSAISGREETYDLARGRTLSASERDEYATALAAQIAKDDGAAALTAGALGLQGAVDALRAKADAPGWFGLSVRRALAQLGHGDEVVEQLANDAKDPGSVTRFGALMALAETGGTKNPRAVEAMLAGLDDAEPTVRAQAFKGLVRVLGVERYGRNAADDDVELRSPLQRLDLLLGAKLTSLREPARAELTRIANGILEGKTPESLGLPYQQSVERDVMLRLGRSLFNPTADLPLQELEVLTGADRAYAESLIAKSLDRELERAPAALAALQATWALPALHEAADASSNAAFKQAAAAAIRQLESD